MTTNSPPEKGTPTAPSHTPQSKKKTSVKAETPTKGKKRQQETKEDGEPEETLFKKKRERPESPSESLTTDSGSAIDDVDNTEQEPEPADPPTPVIPSEPATPVKIEIPNSEEKMTPSTPEQPTTPCAPLPVIQNIPNPPKVANINENMNPVNVSIKLPDDLTERKNLIRKSLDLSEKEIKFNPTEPIKTELKVEEPVKTEIKEENVKTELIIPKVIPMEKALIKEEIESSNDALIIPKEEIYKEGLFMPQNLNIKDQSMTFAMKDQLNEHMNFKESQQLINPCNKENKELLNHQNYGLKDVLKQETYNFANTVKEQPPVNHTINTVIKLEPRDEPIELTNNSTQQPREIYPPAPPPIQNPPITIPTVIPMSQVPQQPPTNRNEQYEEEKRPERPEIGQPPLQIGQPPLPNLMQTGNLVTIGGNQPMNHYGYLGSPYGHANPSPRSLDKNTLPHMPSTSIPMSVAQPVMPSSQPVVNLQNEPQNLKIKQEVSDTVVQVSSAPTPPSNQPMANDPLQSLKDVKVPGFSLPSAAVSQPLAGNIPNSDNRPSSGHSGHSFMGPGVDNIKKEIEYSPATSQASIPIQSVPNPPLEKSPAPKIISSNPPTPSTATPPLRIQATPPPQVIPMSHSAANLISPSSTSLAPPTSIPQPVMHPSQQTPFGGPMPPPHLIHHPFLAMHPYHSHPYAASAGYPFPYPYPYGPVPQPHAIPPPQGPGARHEAMIKPTSTIESSTVLTTHHSSSSSIMTRREVQVRESEDQERQHAHETTMTQHHSTSHHSSVHASTEKSPYGGNDNNNNLYYDHINNKEFA